MGENLELLGLSCRLILHFIIEDYAVWLPEMSKWKKGGKKKDNTLDKFELGGAVGWRKRFFFFLIFMREEKIWIEMRNSH